MKMTNRDFASQRRKFSFVHICGFILYCSILIMIPSLYYGGDISISVLLLAYIFTLVPAGLLMAVKFNTTVSELIMAFALLTTVIIRIGLVFGIIVFALSGVKEFFIAILLLLVLMANIAAADILPEDFAEKIAKDYIDPEPEPSLMTTSPLGLSSLTPTHWKGSSSIHELEFKTLQTRLTSSQEHNDHKELLLNIRFLIQNRRQEEIVIEDIHVAAYESRIPLKAPVSLDISARSMSLSRDNTLNRDDDSSYSLAPGDGFQVDLVIQAKDPQAPCRVIFGLLLDFYTTDPTIDRATVPSDCVYVFASSNMSVVNLEKQFGLIAIDQDYIRKKRTEYEANKSTSRWFDQVEKVLLSHLSRLPIPRRSVQ